MSTISNYRYSALVRDLAIWSKALDDAKNCEDLNAYVADCIDRWIVESAGKGEFCPKTLLHDVATYRVNPRAVFEPQTMDSYGNSVYDNFISFLAIEASDLRAVLQAVFQKDPSVKRRIVSYIIVHSLGLVGLDNEPSRCRAGNDLIGALEKNGLSFFWVDIINACDKFARKTFCLNRGVNDEN